MSLFSSIMPATARQPATSSSESQRQPTLKPHYEFNETQDAYGITAYVPGVAKEGLSITAEDSIITIRGERSWKRPNGWTVLYRESAEFPYELTLEHDNAVDVDKIHAELRDGVLRISLPKTEARKPRKIAVA